MSDLSLCVSLARSVSLSKQLHAQGKGRERDWTRGLVAFLCVLSAERLRGKEGKKNDRRLLHNRSSPRSVFSLLAFSRAASLHPRRDGPLKAIFTHTQHTLTRSLCRCVKMRRKTLAFSLRRRRRRPSPTALRLSLSRLSFAPLSLFLRLSLRTDRICDILACAVMRSHAVERRSKSQRGRERAGTFPLLLRPPKHPIGPSICNSFLLLPL